MSVKFATRPELYQKIDKILADLDKKAQACALSTQTLARIEGVLKESMSNFQNKQNLALAFRTLSPVGALVRPPIFIERVIDFFRKFKSIFGGRTLAPMGLHVLIEKQRRAYLDQAGDEEIERIISEELNNKRNNQLKRDVSRSLYPGKLISELRGTKLTTLEAIQKQVWADICRNWCLKIGDHHYKHPGKQKDASLEEETFLAIHKNLENLNGGEPLLPDLKENILLCCQQGVMPFELFMGELSLLPKDELSTGDTPTSCTVAKDKDGTWTITLRSSVRLLTIEERLRPSGEGGSSVEITAVCRLDKEGRRCIAHDVTTTACLPFIKQAEFIG